MPAQQLCRFGTWLTPSSQGRDVRRILLLDESLKSLQELLRVTSANDAWQQATFDLSRYRGRQVGVYFEAVNDDDARKPRTWMAIDDVSLTACR